MISYFYAELLPVQNGVHRFEVRTLVRGKKIGYCAEIPDHILIAEGYIDVFMEEATRKIKAEIKKQLSLQSIFEQKENHLVPDNEQNPNDPDTSTILC